MISRKTFCALAILYFGHAINYKNVPKQSCKNITN